MTDDQYEIVTVDTTPQPLERYTRANSDHALIDSWVRNLTSDNSRKAYRTAVDQFNDFSGKGLHQVTVEDLQDYRDHLAATYDSKYTQSLKLNAVKSLLAYGQTSGYLRFNVGVAVKATKVGNDLAQRILTKDQVRSMVYHPGLSERDRLLLRVLYASAGRVSEISALCWRDLVANGESGQITVTGKGEKVRAIKLDADTYRLLVQSKPVNATPDHPVFQSSHEKDKHNPLNPDTIAQVVKKAGKLVGIEGVSPHWFRHSHASHALDGKANIALVAATLGHSNIATTSKYTHARPEDSSSLYLGL